jgi:hypothetical protein
MPRLRDVVFSMLGIFVSAVRSATADDLGLLEETRDLHPSRQSLKLLLTLAQNPLAVHRQ